MSSKAPSWKPVRRGDVYCSTACGFGCTKAAYDAAKVKSKRLAARCGPAWRGDVWENMGWHHAATKGDARVIPHRGSGFTVYFDTAAKQFLGQGKTPTAAIADAVKNARRAAITIIDAMKRVTE